MLYFIKGDSQQNWGAAKMKVGKNGSVSAVINGMEKNGWKCVTSTAFNAWRKQNTAQQNAHQTGRESAAKVGFLTLEEDAAIKADNTPAHPQVA